MTDELLGIVGRVAPLAAGFVIGVLLYVATREGYRILRGVGWLLQLRSEAAADRALKTWAGGLSRAQLEAYSFRGNGDLEPDERAAARTELARRNYPTDPPDHPGYPDADQES